MKFQIRQRVPGKESNDCEYKRKFIIKKSEWKSPVGFYCLVIEELHIKELHINCVYPSPIDTCAHLVDTGWY